MNNKCIDIHKNIKTFFGSFDRIIVICFCIISFILNLIITISICLTKDKKISVIIRLTASILVVNFINIFSYIFQWVICKEESNNDKSYYNILLLIENSNNFVVCKLQSFILLASSLSQDYLIILFFFIVNRKNMIEVSCINLLSLICVLVPILISFLYLLLNGFGINDDFCYLKKFELKEKLNYKYFDNYKYYFLVIYSLRGINFAISILFLIKIINYLSKEKSIFYILNKLSMLFIQLFKLFIILSYRIVTLFLNNNTKIINQIYIILSTIDGLLLPLAFCFSNDIFNNCFKNGKKSRSSTIDEKDSEEEIMPPLHILPKEDEGKNGPKSVMYNSNNFDLSY